MRAAHHWKFVTAVSAAAGLAAAGFALDADNTHTVGAIELDAATSADSELEIRHGGASEGSDAATIEATDLVAPDAEVESPGTGPEDREPTPATPVTPVTAPTAPSVASPSEAPAPGPATAPVEGDDDSPASVDSLDSD